MYEKKETTVISARISKELYEILRKKAYDEHKSQRSIVEEAIKTALYTNQK